MNFFKKLFPSPHPTQTFYIFSVRCNRCGESIQGQVDLRNEPSLELDDNGKASYLCRKVLMGNGRCFQQIEVVFRFDDDRRLVNREITGGEFVGD
jgi:DNA-directed RNA polymerase subunit N (RpoN/RPB10)